MGAGAAGGWAAGVRLRDPMVWQLTAGRAAGRALFGPAGLASRAPAGMSTRMGGLDPAGAERLLHARGVTVLPIPTVAPRSPPPA